ncbi:MAG: hypothetical protein GY875_22480 [Gammaproteobacteria bacterium]|nr:hypothetical protein [Gammaproteobacteria bacterium]
MTESATYSVLLSGDLKSGFEAEQVVGAFASLFKLTPEKAGAIIGKRFVVKREVELSVAKAYQEKLTAIGVDVRLKRHGGIDELALEPVQLPASKDGEPVEPLAPDEMICPKCELRQTKAEECSGCGVFVDKVHKIQEQEAEAEAEGSATPAASTTVAAAEAEGNPTGASVVPGDQPVTMKWLIAPMAVAVLGALLWYFIAVTFEYEFGWIAWLIGGAIGYAALATGARGIATGVVCGMLVIVSICGGKYMTVASYQAELAEMMSTPLEFEGIDMQAFYRQEINDARVFATLGDDDASLRYFMVEYEYSEFSKIPLITDDELEMFREYTAPRLKDIHLNRPSFDEWRQYSLGTIEDLSTFDLMVDSLGLIDFVFFFFGIGTAFRLASHGI